MQNLLFGIVTHGAGVQEYRVGIIYRVCRLVATHLHDTGHYLRVGHVHLAPISLNIQFLHHSSLICAAKVRKICQKEGSKVKKSRFL
jgi:hypothetical protein